MDKKQARALAKERRDVLPASVKVGMERKIAGRIEAASWYREAGAVLSYVSFRSEVSTAKIHRRILRDGKKLYLPKTFPDSREMIFFETGDLERLVSGYRGILEPEDTWPEWKGRENTIMLMPGVAFDEYGSRVGYGGGYYDRFLSIHRGRICRCIMLAFEAQRVPEIQREPWDEMPDEIVTEHGSQNMEKR